MKNGAGMKGHLRRQGNPLAVSVPVMPTLAQRQEQEADAPAGHE